VAQANRQQRRHPSETQFETAVEIGQRYKIDPETVKRQYRQGLIPGYRIGRALRFDPEELREHFRSTPSAAIRRAQVTAEPNFNAIDAP
jgi:hypothetical protein